MSELFNVYSFKVIESKYLTNLFLLKFQGEAIEVDDWDDLKKLEPLDRVVSNKNKEVFHDCLSTL